MMKTLFEGDGFNFNIYGDYVMECMFPESITDQLMIYFEQVQAISDLDIDMFADIFDMKAKCKMTLRHSPQHSQILRDQYPHYFGK